MCLSLLISLILNNLEFSKKKIWQKCRFHPWPFSCSCFQPEAFQPSASLKALFHHIRAFLAKWVKITQSRIWGSAWNQPLRFSRPSSQNPRMSCACDSQGLGCSPEMVQTFPRFASLNLSPSLVNIMTMTENYSHSNDEGSPHSKHLRKGLSPINYIQIHI